MAKTVHTCRRVCEASSRPLANADPADPRRLVTRRNDHGPLVAEVATA